ncbi:MAG: DUF4364 family protein [Lachnospiraceae bacterium]|nr:DUF4364 family protein [Lachnospiraceae bacterium]
MESESLTLCKLIILYMLNRVDFLMTSAQISDFILGSGYADFITLSQAQSELIDNGLISVSQAQSSHNRTHLCITGEGKETLFYFRNRISDGIKNEIEDYFRDNAFEMKNELAVYGDYYKSTTGEFETHLVVQDRDIKLMDLTLSVPTEEIAEHICDSWREKSEGIYQYLTKELF